MKFDPLKLIIPGSEPHMSISSAIEAAAIDPKSAVWIPPDYNPQETFTNPTGVIIYDMRTPGTISGVSQVTTLPSFIDGGTF